MIFNHSSTHVLQYTLGTHQFHCCLAAPLLAPQLTSSPFQQSLSQLFLYKLTRTQLQCSDSGQCICTGTVFWENREDWSNSSLVGGVPEICFWEALRSQELSFSKSKLEHHKSVPSSWTLGSAKRENADFFKDLAGALSRVSGVVSEHAFLLFNLFSRVMILTFAFSDIHRSLPKLKLRSTGQRLSSGSCVQRPQCSNARMFQMGLFSLVLFFFLNN